MVCSKCTALSEIFTNSPLTIIPDSIPLKNLPLKNNNLLLLPLKSISNSEAYFSQILTRIDNADLHGANSVMSSAYTRAPAKRLPIWHPTPVSSNRFNNPSVYIANRIGDNTPPCFTPFETVNSEDTVFPHFTRLSDPGYFVPLACRRWYKKAHPYYFNN